MNSEPKQAAGAGPREVTEGAVDLKAFCARRTQRPASATLA